jgi:hypothetical protein
MKQLKTRLKETVNIFSESHKTYRTLRKQLNKQPIGYPSATFLNTMRSGLTLQGKGWIAEI